MFGRRALSGLLVTTMLIGLVGSPSPLRARGDGDPIPALEGQPLPDPSDTQAIALFAAKLEEAVATLERVVGVPRAKLMAMRDQIQAAYRVKVDRFVTTYRTAGPKARASLVEAFAGELWDSETVFTYNARLRVLGEYLERGDDPEAFSAVGVRLSELWQSARWKRRLIIGGVVVAGGLLAFKLGPALAAAVIFAYGLCAMGPTAVTITWLAVTAATMATVLSVVPLYVEYFMKANPSTVLFPEAMVGLRKLAASAVVARLEAVDEPVSPPGVGFEGFELTPP